MRAACLALLAVLAATPLAAQDTAPAVDAARAYMDAFAAEDWRAAAERVDRDDLAQLQPFVALIGGIALDDPDFQGAEPPSDPVDAFAWFMDVMTDELPMLGDMMGTAQGRVLGAVAETDSLVHVVQRSTVDMMGAEVSQVDVVSVRLSPDGAWRVALGGQLDAFSQMSGMLGAFGGEPLDEGGRPQAAPGGKAPPKPRADG